MKHLNIYGIALLALIASPGLLHAQAMTAGKVQAFIVQGDVQLTQKDGTTAPLTRGETFEEGSIVKAGPTGQALLVFSNGATMKLLANGQLAVTQFQQAPFDEQAEGTFLRLSKDPSKSTTTLDLRNGTLTGEVKQLNQAAGSKFTVNTPAGSAGIRGTMLTISVTRDSAGHITGITCTCMLGNVGFTPSTSVAASTATSGTTTTANNTNVANADVNSGAVLQVSLSVDANGNISGGSITGGALPTATAQDLANALADTINTARTQAGLAAQPPPSITATTGVDLTSTNGQTTALNATAVTINPAPTTNSSGTGNYSASPIPVNGTPTNNNPNTTTVPPTVPPPNTNPSTVSTF